VGRAFNFGLGKPVGDGFEAKRGKPVEGVQASAFEKAFVVIVGVDKGDVKASEVKEFC